MQEATARDAGSDMRLALVDALCRVQIMREHELRQSFVRQLARAVGDLPDIRDNPATRMHVIDIVDACLGRPRGMRGLVATLRLFAPEDHGSIEAVDLIRRFTVLETVSREDRQRLAELLAQAGQLDVRTLWFAATEEVVPMPAVPVMTLEAAYDHLAGLNARTDGLPPGLALVEYTAARLSGTLAAQLRRWNDEQARPLGLSTELDALRRHAEATPLLAPAPPCLVVQLAEHGIIPGHYILSHWIQHRPGRWHPERGEDQTVTLDTAAAAVEGLVARAEAAWGTLPGRVGLEFVLPTALLNEPVDWWLTSPEIPASAPLCVDYPVVIRSLERMRALKCHRFWRNRWEAMAAAQSLRAHWGLGSEDDLSIWNAQLHSDEGISTVILGQPPAISPEARGTQLWLAMLAGVPVMLWDRRKTRTGNFRDFIDQLVGGAPMSLADRVQQLRRQAAILSDTDRADHLGRHLAVLWDDPNRLVDVAPYAPLAMEGQR